MKDIMIFADRFAKSVGFRRLEAIGHRGSMAMGLIVLLTALALVGCNGGVREEVIEIRPAVDTLANVKSILIRYERGEPLGSEAASFDSIVAEVKKADPIKASIVDEGFKKILQSAPQQRAEIAAELLREIAGS